MRYTFADCELDMQLYTLRRSGQRLRLRPKVFQVLRYLLEHRHRVVTKQELLEHVWPEQFISEATLDNCIKDVRQILGDSGRDQRLIQTLRGYGYRFVAAIETQTAAHHDSTPNGDGATASPALSASCPEPAAAQRVLPPVPSAGERKVVTILCCALSETPTVGGGVQLDALHSRLRTLHAVVQGEVHRYGGTVQHVASEHLLAVFGAPVAHEDHAQRAVLAALGIQQRAGAPRAVGTTRSEAPLAIRIGLHTGLVAVGGLGDEAGTALTVIGDVARLAALLQARAAPGMVLCSTATAHLVRDIVHFEVAEPVPVVGQTTPVTTYTILRHHPPSLPVIVRGGRVLSRFVGRARELAFLQALLAQVAAGRGQVVGIIGDPGMGKSRLLAEFRHALRSTSVTSVEGRCRSYGQGTPYLPVLEMLRHLCGISDADPDEALVTKVQSAVQAVGVAAADWAPSLLHLLGVQAGTTAHALPPPDVLKSRTFEVLRQVLLHRSLQQPLVLAIDNLHWIDPTSEEYMASLVDHLAGAPLLLLVTYRPGYRPSWIEKSYATQLALQPLDAQDSQMVLKGILRSHPVPDALFQTILRTAEGNPFFLEELAWTVVEQGAASPTLAVPDTIQAVLTARIDRLPPEAKRLLQIAAVIGIEVPVALVQALAQGPEEMLHGALAHLQAAEFLYETRLVPDQAYTFKHALTHEVAYGSLLQERRQTLHAQIVEALETLAGDRVAEQVERLAHHALRGQVWDKALRYCRQAGDKAFFRSAYREAVGYFEQALAALAHLPSDRITMEQAIDLCCDLGMALIPFDQWEQRLPYLRDAEAIAERLGDQRRPGHVYHRIAVTLRQMQALEPALAYCQRAHAIATALGDGVLQVWINHDMSSIYVDLGDYRQAMACCQQMLTALAGIPYDPSYRAPAHPSIQARVYMVICLCQLGEFAKGVAYGDDARQIAEAGERPYERVAVYYRVGTLYVYQGTLHLAIPLLERTVALSQDANIPIFYRLAVAALARAYALADRAPDALALLEQMGEIDDLNLNVPLNCGEAYLRTGNVKEADQLAQRVLANARHHKMRGWESWALWLLGEIAMRRDPPDVAQAAMLYQQALALAEALGLRPLQAHCHCGLGTLYATTGQRAQAGTELSAAITLYRAMDMTFWLPQVEATLAQVESPIFTGKIA